MVGYFNLDPYRVLDLILNACEANLNKVIFEKMECIFVDFEKLDKLQKPFFYLIESNINQCSMKTKPIVHLLGLKLQYFNQMMKINDRHQNPRNVIPFLIIL